MDKIAFQHILRCSKAALIFWGWWSGRIKGGRIEWSLCTRRSKILQRYGGGDREPEVTDGDMEDEMIDLNGITVEEHTNEKYECSEFVLSKLDEKRIFKSWRRGIIVKLLRRRI